MSSTEHPSVVDLYERAPCGLVTVSRRGNVIAANAAFRDMVGETLVDNADSFLDLLRAGDRIFWETHVNPLLDMEGQVREIAIELKTEAGQLPVLMNARNQAPADPSGHVDLVLFPAADRRSYERELLAARRRAEISESHARLLAETLQRSLIPPSIPDIPGLEVGATYRPAGTGAEVGGDFYDFFRISPTEWMVALGDVCGKGAGAATVTALVRYAIRGAAMETRDLEEVFRAVNATLLLDQSNEMCTAAVGRMSPAADGHHIALTLAGHPLPLHVDATGRVGVVGKPGTLLGALGDVRHEVAQIHLATGESLVFFTDGVTEARRGAQFFGEQRLRELLARNAEEPPSAIAEAVGDAVEEYQDGALRDDVAVVVVRSI